jgi:hypothetical protein
MAITLLNSFAAVQQFITQILSQNREQGGVHVSPHKAFWNTMTYDEFVSGNVPSVSDPNSGSPLPILVKGHSAQSNLILALRGIGQLFGSDGAIGQMPADGPPYFTPDQIDSIAAWIDAGCPR